MKVDILAGIVIVGVSIVAAAIAFNGETELAFVLELIMMIYIMYIICNRES